MNLLPVEIILFCFVFVIYSFCGFLVNYTMCLGLWPGFHFFFKAIWLHTFIGRKPQTPGKWLDLVMVQNSPNVKYD